MQQIPSSYHSSFSITDWIIPKWVFSPLSPLPGQPQWLVFPFLSTVDVHDHKGLESAPSKLSQAHPMCTPLGAQKFPHPNDAYPVAPRSQDMHIAIWRCGTHRQVSMLNQVTQAAGSPPEVTQISLLSLHGCWVPPSTPASPLNRKAISRATGPHPLHLQQAQKMKQPPSSPLRCRRWMLWETSAPVKAQHCSEHPEDIQLTTTTWHSTAQRCLISTPRHHLRAVATLISVVWNMKRPCYLRSMSWSMLLSALGPPNHMPYVTHIESCPENASKGQVLHT